MTSELEMALTRMREMNQAVVDNMLRLRRGEITAKESMAVVKQANAARAAVNRLLKAAKSGTPAT